ncbi:FixH family protein [Pseudomaricurvus sp.]|uniref:FixH family protein n=1 Tax=Pseudomaricurvus sp. TaxID=2004510 RepID=UPI003F6D520B
MTEKNLDGKDDGPWYKQFWAWFVFAPLLIIMAIWVPFLTVIVKGADDTVLDNYYKEGRMINQRVDQDRHARELGLTGTLRVDQEVGDVILTISSIDADYAFPEKLELYFDHPFEADHDTFIVLQEVIPGRYQGELERRLNNRWYIRLTSMPVTTAELGAAAPDLEDWRIIGELDLAKGSSMTFGGDE